VKKGKGKPKVKTSKKSPIPVVEKQLLEPPETPPVNDLPAMCILEHRCPSLPVQECDLAQRFYGIDRRMWPVEDRDCTAIEEACTFLGLDFQSEQQRLCLDYR
jgi:hypothetical protein